MISRAQACRFLLAKNGLLGDRVFRGEEGAAGYVRQAGCIQCDPVDVCGKNHELALLSRVKGFTREMLPALLYEQRVLMDSIDKNMCIMSTSDWPCMAFLRELYSRRSRQREDVNALSDAIVKLVGQLGHAEPGEMVEHGLPNASWNRMAMEELFARGDLMVHHSQNNIRSFSLTQDTLPPELYHAPNPFAGDLQRQAWQVLRRIGAVGMLWDAGSEAWQGVMGMTPRSRTDAFLMLARAGRIVPVPVEGIDRPLFVRAEDTALLRACAQPSGQTRSVRLLAPLDCLLWDRKLIMMLFGFDHRLETGVAEEQRHYGYYVLPVIWEEGFAGRIEPAADRDADALVVRRFWQEPYARLNNRFWWALEDELDLLRRFLGLKRVVWQDGWQTNVHI